MYSVIELQEKVNAEIKYRIEELSGKQPAELYAPVKYALEMGGKRLRPVLLLLGCNMFSDDVGEAMPAAVAVEVFHNFTLLHDDIMDNANVRRNRPAVHVEFSKNNAVLSGDVMAFLSYQYLMECKSGKLFDVIDLFTKTAMEVCEGQQFDMDFENSMDVTANEYLKMIELKTAVLLGTSLKAGTLLANADDFLANQLNEFGINLGLAFQLQDDLLDTFGNQQYFGKEIGGDIVANKKTYLLIKALENASVEQLNELSSQIKQNNTDKETKVNAVKKIYQQLGIKEITENKIDFYFKQSEEILKNLPVDDKKKIHLQMLSLQMLRRNH
jgi:geranylgeranyl diphosphate synthase type II